MTEYGSRFTPEQAISSEWPVVGSPDIDVINPHGQIAITTLWTSRDVVTSQFDGESQVSIVGQLYSPDGINIALRNILSNKNIRYLVICGADLQNSGETLVDLWQGGLDENRRIINSEQVQIDSEIPTSEIEGLRRNVSLVDLREAKTVTQIGEAVGQVVPTLEHLPPWGEPSIFPQRKIEVAEKLPHPGSAELIRAGNVGEAWLEVLHRVMRFGGADMTNYNVAAKDLHNLVVVVNGGNPFSPDIPEYFPFDIESLQRYMDEFTSPVVPPGVLYTYGNRLKKFGEFQVDQVQIIEDKLLFDPNDRGAMAILYDVARDNRISPETEHIAKENMRTPCLVDIQGNVVDDSLELTAHFRSQDMYGGWPANVLGLRRLQGEMAQRLSLDVGSIITITNRAHIYSSMWPAADQILKNYRRDSSGFSQDGMGSFRVEIADGNIVITHMDPMTGRQVQDGLVWKATRKEAAVGLGRRLEAQGVVGQTGHAFYLGGEVIMAQLCARLGIPYTQDSDMVDRIVAHFEIDSKT